MTLLCFMMGYLETYMDKKVRQMTLEKENNENKRVFI